MKFIKALPVYLLGIIFIASSLQFFYSMIWPTQMPEMSGVLLQYFTVLATTKYLLVVKICEFVFGILILVPRTRKLGLVLIAPIIVNIFLSEVLVAKTTTAGIPLIILVAIALYQNRAAYLPMIQNNTSTGSGTV